MAGRGMGWEEGILVKGRSKDTRLGEDGKVLEGMKGRTKDGMGRRDAGEGTV